MSGSDFLESARRGITAIVGAKFLSDPHKVTSRTTTCRDSVAPRDESNDISAWLLTGIEGTGGWTPYVHPHNIARTYLASWMISAGIESQDWGRVVKPSSSHGAVDVTSPPDVLQIS